MKYFKLFFIITLLVLISFISFSCCCLISEYYNSIEDSSAEDSSVEEESNSRYDSIKAELSDSSDYYISPEEEGDFYRSLGSIYSGEELGEVTADMEKLKSLYPKGFFIIVKTAPLYMSGFEIFYYEMPEITETTPILDLDITPSRLNILVHEYTHIGGGPFSELFDIKKEGYVYLMGNFGISIEKDIELFEKTEVYQDISNPDDFDSTYLEPGTGNDGIDFMNILDEVNAYTRSVETMIAFEESISAAHHHNTRYSLLKQMMHLELYLKRAYDKHPEDWEYIIDHKGLSFLIMKLWQEASRFENIIKDDNRFNLNSEPVSEFVYNLDNYSIMEKLFNDSGVIQHEELRFKEADFDKFEVLPVP